ncbi:MAG: hypothetical protein IIA61_02980 [Candidatus Marinimicrobia bacterium]|nr:hypothetical protein [Candidatus Neomarinimicrobiota bacterium]
MKGDLRQWLVRLLVPEDFGIFALAQSVVDASKDPYRLFWFSRTEEFDLYVIYLTKNPRTFVYSMTKSNPRDFKKVIRMCTRYVVENTIIEKVLYLLPEEHTIKVRY